MASGYSHTHWSNFWSPPQTPIIPISSQYIYIAPLLLYSTDLRFEENLPTNHLLNNRISYDYYNIIMQAARGVVRPQWVKYTFVKVILMLYIIGMLLRCISDITAGDIVGALISVFLIGVSIYLIRKAGAQYVDRMSITTLQMNKILGELSNMLLSNTNIRAKAGLNCYWVEFYALESMAASNAVLAVGSEYNPNIRV